MYYVPGLKAFFFEEVSYDQSGHVVFVVTLNRIDPAVKHEWPPGKERPSPVLGHKVLNSSGKKERVIREFADAFACQDAEFNNLGYSCHFSIYLTWEDYLNRNPLDYVDRISD